MRTNQKKVAPNATTREGGKCFAGLKPIDALRRSVLACMLFEDSFYESGQDIYQRMDMLVSLCGSSSRKPLKDVSELAIEARTKYYVRHASLMLVRLMAKHADKLDPENLQRHWIEHAANEVCQRADEPAELIAMIWEGKRGPIPAAIKRGLGKAFGRFDGYQLMKYRGGGRQITTRDAMRLSHASPRNLEQAEIWKRYLHRKNSNPLPEADTWENALMSGGDKREQFTRLIKDHKLGYLALIRNLRGMSVAGVDANLIKRAILERRGSAHKVLPFRFIAAMRSCPQFSKELDESMLMAIQSLPPLPGFTIVLTDVSQSMAYPVSKNRLKVRPGESANLDINRMDAASALASMVKATEVRAYTFSQHLVEIPHRLGLSGMDTIRNSQQHSSTRLAKALTEIREMKGMRKPDRVIVITDEQSQDGIIDAFTPHSYVINVGVDQYGVGDDQGWTKIHGFSEQTLRFIHEIEEIGGLRPVE